MSEDLELGPVRDMLSAINAIDRHWDEPTFMSDELLRAFVVQQLIALGNHARRASGGLHSAHPEIPWRALAELRNMLVHVHRDVTAEQLIKLVVDDLPVIRDQLDAIAGSAA